MSDASLPESSSVTAWLLSLDDPLQAEDALRKIWERYGAEITRPLAQHIHQQFRSVIDAEDVAQEAFAAWIRGHESGQHHAADRNELWKLLVTIGYRRLYDKIRHEKRRRPPPVSDAAPPDGAAAVHDSGLIDVYGAAHADELQAGRPYHEVRDASEGRGYRRNLPVEGPLEPSACHDLPPLDLLLLEASPDMQVAVWGVCEKLDDSLRGVFLLLLCGFANDEIADKLQMSPGRVRHKIELIHRLLQEEAAAQPVI